MAALTGGKLVSLDSLEASADVAALKKVRKLQISQMQAAHRTLS